MTTPSRMNNNNCDTTTTTTDQLIPPFVSMERHSSLVPATFNLVATIVGGGVLSLPLAFEKCGIALATVLMLLAAITTDRSLYLLCLSARHTGATSYGEVGRMAFGKVMERLISLLLFVFLLFVLVAYMVLCRDIWTPLVNMAFLRGQQDSSVNDDDVIIIPGDWVLLGILVVLAPFLVQRTLHALRFNCYIGFGSVSILCMALCRQGLFVGGLPTKNDMYTNQDSSSSVVETTQSTTNQSTNDVDMDDMVYMLPDTPGDVLFALPIILLSFLCHFNVLSIQGALIRPSRIRMQSVIGSAITASLTLMYLFGLGGYLYAREATKGNILLNVVQVVAADHRPYGNLDNMLFLLGRIGCGTTILLATPLMALPCRDSLLEIIDVTLVPRQEEHDHHIVEEGRRRRRRQQSGGDTDDSMIATEETTLLVRHEPIQHDLVFTNPYWHYGSTAGIILVCYAGAVAAPGVAIVWSLCGSTMAFLIAFILPAACYIRIQQKNAAVLLAAEEDGISSISSVRMWMWFAWILLIVSSMTAAACTYQTVQRLWAKSQL